MSRKKSNAKSVGGVSQEEVQPWHMLGGVEHICELRKSAQVLYAILVSILRMMYSGKEGRTFGCPDVVWKNDPEKTQVWIDTELRWEDMRPDFTPAIFVSLGELKYEFPPTMDGQARTFLSNDGEQHYERTVQGTATIVHVCDKAGPACCLADNTENYLSSLQDQISLEYCFDHFTVTGRLPRQQKETPQTAGKGKYVSVVSVQFDYTDSWFVKIESPILRKVSMMDLDRSRMRVAGSSVEISNGKVEIEFGDASSETDIPMSV